MGKHDKRKRHKHKKHEHDKRRKRQNHELDAAPNKIDHITPVEMKHYETTFGKQDKMMTLLDSDKHSFSTVFRNNDSKMGSRVGTVDYFKPVVIQNRNKVIPTMEFSHNST